MYFQLPLSSNPWAHVILPTARDEAATDSDSDSDETIVLDPPPPLTIVIPPSSDRRRVLKRKLTVSSSDATLPMAAASSSSEVTENAVARPAAEVLRITTTSAEMGTRTWRIIRPKVSDASQWVDWDKSLGMHELTQSLLW